MEGNLAVSSAHSFKYTYWPIFTDLIVYKITLCAIPIWILVPRKLLSGAFSQAGAQLLTAYHQPYSLLGSTQNEATCQVCDIEWVTNLILLIRKWE